MTVANTATGHLTVHAEPGHPPRMPYHVGQLVEVDGFLAQFRWDVVDDAAPRVTYTVAVSDIPADWYPDATALNQVCHGRGRDHWSGEVYVGKGRYVTFITDDWPIRTVSVPIPKPRDGREHTWRWGGMWQGWQKEGYPRCPECRGTHAPGLPMCEECGRCHKPANACRWGSRR